MILKNQNILFFTRSMNLGGTENVVLQLCEIFNPLVNKIVVCSCGGLNEKRLSELNIRHYRIGDVDDKNLGNMCRIMKNIERIVKKEHITVIHTHHRMAAFYVELTSLYRHCYFINTSHNTFYNRRQLTRMAYKHAHLIACGDMVRKNLVEFFGLSDVTVIHNAVKPFDGEIVIDETLKKDRKQARFLIGNIGRLSEQKGMEYYIKAVPEVVKNHPESQFYIIGAGEDEEKLKKMSKGLPIHFLGYRNDVQNLMLQLDLVVLSSLWDGLPLTPIEAFSVGKTIVATNVDGTLEIVKNAKNGLLVEPKNSEQIAKKISWIIEHPEERMKMEKAAKETFDKEFSFQKLSNSYIEFYERL